ncbi:GGDEF domain-containing response regulator [Methylobacter sp.]|uniref:two-component system response regulator n=1 Tax=Methylobacter sp. TaxID=2051955 RepID=UPI001220E465|nr:GGDEF domain-containing response regulator [Methylobacter sp.]TAK62968.1 MAG: EAL domain-containing protein [Methylobacter sp.]
MGKIEVSDREYPRPTILIVDDTRDNQELLVSLLKQDYRVKVAGNGPRALDIAQCSPYPDLILLDVNMSEMDGYEVCRRLQENPLTRDIPVIFVTAASSQESETLGLQLGAMDYITKPISPNIALLRVRNQLLLRKSLNKLHLTSIVFENTLECIMITDAQGDIIDVNPAFSRITGYTREEVLGKNPRFLKSGHHDQPFYAEMWHEINTTGYWSGELWNRTKTGECYPELRSISAVTDTQGIVTHYIGISSDISQIKHHEEQLERIAHYDALTGIPNRLLLADRMRQAIAQAKRDRKMLGVCYLDLDGFKPINDTFGHQAGDSVLVEVARRISNILREGDTIARLGGDEFVVLLPDLNHVEECIATLKRLHESISLPVSIQDHSNSLTASIGVSIFPGDDNDPDVLLRHADQAMYIAKQSGKNRYHLFDPTHDRQSRIYQEAMLRIQQGLDKQEFELYYQPKVDLSTREVVSVEALIRWNHPERGLLLPGEFLTDIRNSELEIRLGEWVIDTALGQLMQWCKEGLILDISVNIDACHLQYEGFVEYLKHRFNAHPGLPSGRLHIEILETAALEDFTTVTATIEACRVMGTRFALDDFGTGYSSLTYLHRLPIDTLKIDQSFVRDMLVDKGDNAIVQGVIALAKAFGLKTVAEGIETMEHFEALLAMGCESGQGYGIARPMPVSDLIRWARNSDVYFLPVL